MAITYINTDLSYGFLIISGEVATYATLPAAVTYPGQYYMVTTSTGVWPVNLKRKGIYRSDGATWIRMGELPADLVTLSDGSNADALHVHSGAGVGGFTPTYVPFGSGTGTLTESANLTWNGSQLYVYGGAVAMDVTGSIKCDAGDIHLLDNASRIYWGNNPGSNPYWYIGHNGANFHIMPNDASADYVHIGGSLYVSVDTGGITSTAGLIQTGGTVQAEHLYTTDDLVVDNDADITGELDVVGHSAFGTNGTPLSTYILNADETMTHQSSTYAGYRVDIEHTPAGVLGTTAETIGTYAHAKWNSARDGSTHGYIYGTKSEGISFDSGAINSLIGVEGVGRHQGSGTATNVIGVKGRVVNDDVATESGAITGAYSFLASAYTDKSGHAIADRYGLYIEDTDGSGLLTDQYGIYCPALAGASGDNLFIKNVSADSDFGSGEITCKDITLTDFAAGAETITEILEDTLYGDVLDTITVSDDGGLNISWSAGEIWDHTAKLVIETSLNAGPVACTDDAVNYLYWDRSAAGVTLTLSSVVLPDPTDDDVLIATINCASGDIFEVNQVPIYSEQVPTLISAFRDIFPSIITSGLVVSEHAAGAAFDVDMSGGVYYVAAYGKETIAPKDSTVNNLNRWYKSGAGAWTAVTGQTIIDTTQYNNGTVLAGVTNNLYYRSLFFVTNTGINWVYPTTSYVTLAQAIAGANPEMPDGLKDHPKSTVVILRGSAAAFPAAGSAAWIDVRPILGASISGDYSDHGNLAGLADDDHTQYLLEDGTRDLGGNLTVTGAATFNSSEADRDFIIKADDTTNAYFYDAGNSQHNFNDGALTIDSGGNLFCDAGGSLQAYAWRIFEVSADPPAPNEGETYIWMSDGTEKGDDGDILIVGTAGGVTKWTTLFDHSSGAVW